MICRNMTHRACSEEKSGAMFVCKNSIYYDNGEEIPVLIHEELFSKTDIYKHNPHKDEIYTLSEGLRDEVGGWFGKSNKSD